MFYSKQTPEKINVKFRGGQGKKVFAKATDF
jgi:hypothetical protein